MVPCLDKRLVGVPDAVLKVGVEDADLDAMVLKVSDPLPVDLRIGILDAHPDLLDPREHDPLRAAQLGVVAGAGGTWLQGAEQHRAIQQGAPILPLEEGVLRVIAEP